MDDVKNQQPEQPHVVGYMPDSPDGEPLITLESHEEFVSKLMQPGLEAWQKGRDGMREERDAQRLRADTAEAELALTEKEVEGLQSALGDAEQRISEQHALLLKCKEVFDNCCGMGDQKTRVDWYANYLVPAKVDLNAALNPKPEAGSHE